MRDTTIQTDTENLIMLLGAGFSIPAGMPSTETITDCILTETEIYKADDSFRQGKSPIPGQYEQALTIRQCVTWLKRQVEDYYGGANRRKANYEDIYYMASQLFDSMLGNYDNPTLLRLERAFSAFVKQNIGEDSGTPPTKRYPVNLAWEVTKYIRDLVCSFLNNPPKDTEYIDGLLGQMCDARLEFGRKRMDVFTLNHDTVLEHYFEQKGIKYSDGFERNAHEFRKWDPTSFENNQTDVGLFKLHGSVNWQSCYQSSRLEPDLYWADAISSTLPFTDRNTQGMDRQNSHGPLMLLGTFNKILDYQNEVFTELHYQFYQSLKFSNRMVICGYGFGDKGINTRIIEWIKGNPSRRLVIVNGNYAELLRNARQAIKRDLPLWRKHGRAGILQKCIQSTSWQEVRECFEKLH